MLWVTLYEHDFIGYKDVLSLQSWLLALIEVKYTFPKLPTVPWQDPVPQGELHSQPYMTTPAFNFGGPFGNATYLEFAKTDYGLKSMLEVWEMWMSSKITTNERPKETIIKIILIMFYYFYFNNNISSVFNFFNITKNFGRQNLFWLKKKQINYLLAYMFFK